MVHFLVFDFSIGDRVPPPRFTGSNLAVPGQQDRDRPGTGKFGKNDGQDGGDRDGQKGAWDTPQACPDRQADQDGERTEVERIAHDEGIENVAEFARAGRADLEAGRVAADAGALDAEVAISAYRIVQEALSNIIKHAKAQQVQISLHASAGSLRMVVEDDGVGFDVNSKKGNGLLNMKKRAAELNGTFTINSTVGKGTEKEIMFPL